MEDKDVIGKRFGKLIAIRQVDDYIAPSGSRHKKYLCKCDCGKTASVLKEHLVSGRTKSCGCLRKEAGKWVTTHNEIHTRLYRIWGNMVNRCTNPNNPAWCNYGGRGILVCDEWRSYENFRDWAKSSGYFDKLSLDRTDNNGGYNPDNCRWVDRYTQANNTRSNHLIEYNGVTKTIAEWATVLGVPYKNLHNRIQSLGWSVDRAFNQPYRKSPSKSNC